MKSRKENLPSIFKNNNANTLEGRRRPILYDFDPFSPDLIENLISFPKKKNKSKFNTETFQNKEKGFYFRINTEKTSKKDKNNSKDKFSSLFNTSISRKKKDEQSFEFKKQNNNKNNSVANNLFMTLFRTKCSKTNKNWHYPIDSSKDCVKLDLNSFNKRVNSTEKKVKKDKIVFLPKKLIFSNDKFTLLGNTQGEMKRNKTTGMLSEKTNFVLKDNSIQPSKKFNRSRIKSSFRANNFKTIKHFDDYFKRLNDKTKPNLGWLNKCIGSYYGNDVIETDDLGDTAPKVIFKENYFVNSDFGMKFKLKFDKYSKISAENKFNKKRMEKCKTSVREFESEESSEEKSMKSRFVRNYRSEPYLKY